MPSREELKSRVFATIDARADEIIALSQTILQNPEPGYREVKTAQLVTGKLAEMGLPFRSGLGLTGVRADLRGGSAGPTMALLGGTGFPDCQRTSPRRPGNRSRPRLRPSLPDWDCCWARPSA